MSYETGYLHIMPLSSPPPKKITLIVYLGFLDESASLMNILQQWYPVSHESHR